MVLRCPPLTLDPNVAMAHVTKQVQSSITLDCQLVTPLYSGGVKAHTIDQSMPIRVSSIRGQLRFWWRLLATHLWKLGDVNAIRQAEADLWGGIGDKTKASKVFLRIDTIKNLEIEKWAEYQPNHNGNLQLMPKVWAQAPYALFPAQGSIIEEPHELAREGLTWQLGISFAENIKFDSKDSGYDPNITKEQRKQVWEAIRWWSSFGGVGARTRRGLGAIKVMLNNKLITPITAQEASDAGCCLVLKSKNNAYDAWTYAVNKMKTFRQIGVGRNNYNSRSRWPEPDAIRRITGQSLPKHAERLTTENIFPRAAYGLPIIFKFKDGGDTTDTDPIQTTLTAVRICENNKEVKLDRMASPIILRPYLTEKGQWYAAALLLPSTLGQHNNIRLKLDDKTVEYFDVKKAQDVRPLKNQNQETQEPITAFLNYFTA